MKGHPLARIPARLSKVGVREVNDVLLPQGVKRLEEIGTWHSWSPSYILAIIELNPFVLKASERIRVVSTEENAAFLEDVSE